MSIWPFFALFVFMLLLPFLPGILELIKKEDADPLFISMDYKRNPRYFGKSFREILQRATEGLSGETGFFDVTLSKNESLEIRPSFEVWSDEEFNHLLLVQGDLSSDSRVYFYKEVFVANNASLGPNNVLQALAADGRVDIAGGTLFHRWLDAEGDIRIGEKCTLGISASSGGRLSLSRNCVFRRLYAMPIITGQPGPPVRVDQEPLPPADFSFVRCDDLSLPDETIINQHVIFPQEVKIGRKSIINGHIKSYGNIVLEEDVTINGNILSDGDIFIGRNAIISGHVFSQKTITISSGTIISRPDRIKSIIGKKAIRLEKDVMIYGFVSTEGDGLTL